MTFSSIIQRLKELDSNPSLKVIASLSMSARGKKVRQLRMSKSCK